MQHAVSEYYPNQTPGFELNAESLGLWGTDSYSTRQRHWQAWQLLVNLCPQGAYTNHHHSQVSLSGME